MRLRQQNLFGNLEIYIKDFLMYDCGIYYTYVTIFIFIFEIAKILKYK
jgi:hypothetical protein